jgi:catechol 2,3-dioxygenase-like lactoylglutathione lyase family enzyme
MASRLERVIVAVDDLEEGVEDYARLLGRGASDAGRGLFGLRNTALQLVLREDLAREGVSVEEPGLAALVFEEEGRSEGEWLPLSSTRGVPIALAGEASDAVADAPELAKPGEAVEALDHVVISTADLDAARAFYGSALGLRLALDRSFEGRGLRILFFRTGGLTVEVVGPLTPTSAGGAADAGRDRFGGLAWEVPDVAAIRARLLREGFDVSEERTGHKPGTRVCTVRSRTHGVATLLKGPELG